MDITSICPEDLITLDLIHCGEAQTFKFNTVEEAFAVIVGFGYETLFDVSISFWDLDCNRQVWNAETISNLLAQATVTLEGEGYATHVKVVL
ncbi:hypothetical protein [Pseudomonas phage vB_PaeP_TUMS_P10]|nr:hypothetical protein [Pseudomonas phage vB_PaeS_TUMS_P6]UNI72037.1 hypothetical protein [Pseudomonas phage vB_PaeP_TUMS_P10]